MLHAWKQQDCFYQAPVSLPFALRRKYPNAGRSFEWQWRFPSTGLCTDEDGQIVRHHIHVSAIQKAVIPITLKTLSPLRGLDFDISATLL